MHLTTYWLARFFRATIHRNLIFFCIPFLLIWLALSFLGYLGLEKLHSPAVGGRITIFLRSLLCQCRRLSHLLSRSSVLSRNGRLTILLTQMRPVRSSCILTLYTVTDVLFASLECFSSDEKRRKISSNMGKPKFVMKDYLTRFLKDVESCWLKNGLEIGSTRFASSIPRLHSTRNSTN